MNQKPWYKSVTVIGLVLTAIAGIAAKLGVKVSEDPEALAQTLIDAAEQIGQVAGLVIALYGRLKASTTLTK